MANSAEMGKSNVAEKGLRFLRNVHLAIGGLALAGSVLVPPLGVVAAYEGVNALAHEGARQLVKPKRRANAT